MDESSSSLMEIGGSMYFTRRKLMTLQGLSGEALNLLISASL